MKKRGRKPSGKPKRVVVSIPLDPHVREAMKKEADISGMKPAALGRLAIEKFLDARRLAAKIRAKG